MLLLSLYACDRPAAAPDDPGGDFTESEPALVVTPERIDLGLVRRGEEVYVPVSLTNAGTAPLQILDLELSDAVPGLEVADLGTVLVQPDEATTLTVHFAPTELGAWATTLTIATNDPTTPAASLPLTAESGGPDLDVSIASRDLGDVGIGCSARVTVPIANLGTEALVVTDVSLAGGPEWSIAATDPDVALPWTLTPGAAAAVDVAFTPTAPVAGAATLTLRSNDPTGAATVTLAGAGAYGDDVIDTFVQPSGAASWVFAVDVTASTSDERVRLEAALPAFLDALDADGLPYRIGVVAGADGCLAAGAPLVDDTQARADQLATLGAMLAQAASPYSGLGFTLLDAATSAANLAAGGCNEGLVVADDALALVGVTDAAEQSASPWSVYVARFQALVSDPANLRVHALAGDWPSGCDGADAGEGWYEASVATDGLFESVCATDYDASLVRFAEREGLARRFELSAWPVVDTLAVTLDGAPVLTGWTYAAADNALSFDVAPPAGATIAIGYATHAECG